ncbi:MAG: aminopeptidase P family protein [Deltaproteobacteria bacterium]|nr:aminopeptidase P family protein [Deltaproteobacteria bacterium]
MYDTSLNTPKSEIDARIHKFQATLKRLNLDAAMILQKTDLFYFSGTIQQANLYVPADGEPILMVNRILERVRAESPLERIVPLPSPSSIPGILGQSGYALPGRLGLELDVLPANLYFRYREVFKGAEVADISTEIRLLRAVKSALEIALIREAAEYSDRVAGRVPALLREGMTEIELAGRVEAEARRLGHQGIVRMRMWGAELFYGHLLAGPSGGVPSYHPSPTGGRGVNPAVAQSASFRPIQRNEPVMVDYVFAYRGYISDHTRLFSLGPVPDDLVKAHQTMLALQEQIRQLAKPGAISGSIYDFSLRYVTDRGYAEHFMGASGERVRFVGHGVGLELDEFPFLNTGQTMELQEGMVIAVEPKLVFPGRGVVGIENTHVVTKDGLEQLGNYPGEITVV